MNKKLKIKIIEVFDTQADFAQAISERESVVSRVVRGRRILGADKREKWATALGCKADQIFSTGAAGAQINI